jgi:hypothetical protein
MEMNTNKNKNFFYYFSYNKKMSRSEYKNINEGYLDNTGYNNRNVRERYGGCGIEPTPYMMNEGYTSNEYPDVTVNIGSFKYIFPNYKKKFEGSIYGGYVSSISSVSQCGVDNKMTIVGNFTSDKVTAKELSDPNNLYWIPYPYIGSVNVLPVENVKISFSPDNDSQFPTQITYSIPCIPTTSSTAPKSATKSSTTSTTTATKPPVATNTKTSKTTTPEPTCLNKIKFSDTDWRNKINEFNNGNNCKVAHVDLDIDQDGQTVKSYDGLTLGQCFDKLDENKSATGIIYYPQVENGPLPAQKCFTIKRLVPRPRTWDDWFKGNTTIYDRTNSIAITKG